MTVVVCRGGQLTRVRSHSISFFQCACDDVDGYGGAGLRVVLRTDNLIMWLVNVVFERFERFAGCLENSIETRGPRRPPSFLY